MKTGKATKLSLKDVSCLEWTRPALKKVGIVSKTFSKPGQVPDGASGHTRTS